MQNHRLSLALSFIALLLLGYSCQQSTTQANLRWEAKRLADKAAGLSLEVEALATTNDSLRARVAASDSAYAADVARWTIERRELEQIAITSSSNHDALNARLRAIGVEGVSLLADSLEVAHRATVDAYEARIEGYESQVASLTVRVGDLQSLVGGLELELDTQRRIGTAQQMQIQAWEKLANPPWHERLKGSLPSIGVGATVAVLGLVLAGGL